MYDVRIVCIMLSADIRAQICVLLYFIQFLVIDVYYVISIVVDPERF